MSQDTELQICKMSKYPLPMSHMPGGIQLHLLIEWYIRHTYRMICFN